MGVQKVNHLNFLNYDLSQFRADEEDVFAYVQSIIHRKDKQEILSWIERLPEHDLHSIIVPFLTEKMSEEIGNKEF